MAKEKRNRKKIIIIICIISVTFVVSIFARYVLKEREDFYSRTKEFYFTSDKLGLDCPLFKIENWSGVDDYTITINMNSNQNNILSASYEINYDIAYTCTDNVRCTLSKESGTIPITTESDTFYLTVEPNAGLSTDDIVRITITATATVPYEKEISAEFQLVVGQEEIAYEIIDEEKSPYLELNITNTLSYYTVSESFGSYTFGERISRETYLYDLSNEEKEKCYSSIITLQFDPTVVLLDMTNENYINATSVSRIMLDGFQYINAITFKVDAITGTRVRFYKTDITQDYTYPNQEDESVIIVTVI